MLRNEFRSIVRTHGLLAGMRELNLGTPHRYSAIFGFDGGILHNICIVDKLDPNAALLHDQSIDDSYCIYVKRSRSPLAIADARVDPRVEGHPKRDELYSYYGVPLFGEDGRVLGTVCHFDQRPIPVSEDVVTTLENVTPIIVEAAFGHLARTTA